MLKKKGYFFNHATGSHCHFLNEANERFTLPKVGGKMVKWVYVKQVQQLPDPKPPEKKK